MMPVLDPAPANKAIPIITLEASAIAPLRD